MAWFEFLSGPACGDVKETVMFDLDFRVGVPVNVDNVLYARKLRANPFFREVEEVQPKRGPGRPKKVTADDSDGGATGGAGAAEDGPVADSTG